MLYFKSRNEENNEVIDLLLIEAYHNIYQDKERELQELKNIYNYTNLDYIKRIFGKVIKFEQLRWNMPIAQLDRASVSGTDDSGSTPDRHTFI